MKITAKENGIETTFCSDLAAVIANALMMVAGVTETSAKCRLYRFLWP